MRHSFNKIYALAALLSLFLISSCRYKMDNPFLTASPLPYGAPQFDKIRPEHYLEAFEKGLSESRTEIDSICSNPEPPTFGNTIEALEQSGELLDRVSGIFYNLLEAHTNEPMQDIAEKMSPKMTEHSMYISLNDTLFQRVKAVYDSRDSLPLDKEQQRLLEKTYKGFVRSGALLGEEEKKEYREIMQELSLLSLKFSKNLLDATNAYSLNITDAQKLGPLPDYVMEAARACAAEKGQQGWTFTLSAPSYGPFMQYCSNRDLRRQMYLAYNTRAADTNAEICRKIATLRLRVANILGYKTFADYVTETRMVKSSENALAFLDKLEQPTQPKARKEVADILDYAKSKGFDDESLQAWDFAYWSEKYKKENYDLSDEELKPYFELDSCIKAVFGLAERLYGLTFELRDDIPVYQKDVRVYDVKDSDGSHLALFYCDFFPRSSKRSGAWMTEFRGQKMLGGEDIRPFVSIVMNFSKPTAGKPSLLTHNELTTFLHEFGHSLHGMLSRCRYESLSGTNVDHDFVELPSQIMENWAYKAEYLDSFAKHYETGETIPDSLVQKIVDAKNYNAAYAQLRQLQFGYLDMAWHNCQGEPQEDVKVFEKDAVRRLQLFPELTETCISTSFSHIFAGGYAAGYYSYKWAEMLEADAFSLFEQKGIFNRDVADSFRKEILSRGSTEDESVMYRNFRGHEPGPEALLVKLGICEK